MTRVRLLAALTFLTLTLGAAAQPEGDFRMPTIPPIRPNTPASTCEDAPEDAEILRALRPLSSAGEESRDNIQIVTERLVDKLDPPRFFPLVGWARLHHCHYKCTVYFTEMMVSGFPFPCRTIQPIARVVYIDKDHLHLEPGGAPAGTREK